MTERSRVSVNELGTIVDRRCRAHSLPVVFPPPSLRVSVSLWLSEFSSRRGCRASMNSSVPSSEISGTTALNFRANSTFALDEIELGDSFDGGFDRRKLFAKLFRQGKQYSSDLAFLFAF